ncbi:MAG: hypothetical protein RIA65_10720, partial [Woeseia sp.]
DLQVLDKESTGVSWYPKPGSDNRFDSGASHTVDTSEGALVKAISQAKAGDVILLSPGLHLADRTLIVDRPLTLRSADSEARATIEFERTALFEIADGGSLKLIDLDISGKSAPDAAGNTVIRTSRYSMLNNYMLLVQGTKVSDLNTNHSFNFFTVAKHTFADRIELADSTFSNITGHVLFLHQELEDLGRYNGEYIDINNVAFENIEGTVADIYRGGTDESTFGPHFSMSNSRLQKVGSGKRNKAQASIRLHGVQMTDLHGNDLSHSQPVRIEQTVGEPQLRMDDNKYVATDSPEVREL